jgi:hypothetical protein
VAAGLGMRAHTCVEVDDQVMPLEMTMGTAAVAAAAAALLPPLAGMRTQMRVRLTTT